MVEEPLDVWAMEKMGKFRGVYHVLGGVVNPLEHIGPEELRIRELMKRLACHDLQIKEIILALNPTMEGEATCMYIANEVRKLKTENSKLKTTLTRLARGLPTGGDLEYADEATLEKAMEGRNVYS